MQAPRCGASPVAHRRLPVVSEPSRSASGSAGPATDGDAESAPLVVRTVRIEDAGPLLSLLPDAPDATAWVRRGEGLVGWGVAAVCRTSGPDRFADAKQWWAEHVRTAVVRDEVDQPGTGVVCFGSFGFADEPGRQRARRPRGGRRPPRRQHLADHHRRRQHPVVGPAR